VLLLLAADGIMLAVGLTACALPLRRALRINPTEALRAEG
jgi:ABC-type antimicrobial peptide transport system permease subunit